MSRIVPSEDPLLHPPTPPIPQNSARPAPTQVDDGPIPFMTSAAQDSPSVFTPPTQLPSRGQTPLSNHRNNSQNNASDDNVHKDGAKSKTVDFIDPLSAALEESGSERERVNVPNNSSSSATTSSMPTEFPTHLTSPPLPTRPVSSGATGFSTFQAFSSALQPSTTAGTPATVASEQSTPDPNSRQNTGSLAQDSVGLGLDGATGTTSTPNTNQWAKRISVGISTNPAGISFQDQADLVRQDLKSPVQEHHRQSPGPHSQLSSPPPQSPQGLGRLSQPSFAKAGDHMKEQHLRSPVYSMPTSPIRREGLPVLNAPNMFHEITMSDSLNDLMVKQIPPEYRTLRDWNSLTEAELRQGSRAETLHELTINNSWRAMARYTRSQILSTPSEQIVELINLWYARLLALTKLGQHEMAQAELDQLGDLLGPQYRYESYPPGMFTRYGQNGDENLKGCMVPFELFVLKARLQGHLGDIYEAIDQLYELIMRCKKFEAICRVGGDTTGVQHWQDLAGQLHLLVLNYLVELKDYPAATKHARGLAARYPHDINFHSGLGRLYLQLGDLEQAEKTFKNVEAMVKKHPEHSHFKLQLIMNKALLAVTQGNWQTAKSAFEEILVHEPENLAASNNLAVCELYSGQLDGAITRLEGMMVAYPTSAGTSEPLVFNMATLFELRTEGSMRRKQQMMLDVSKWAGDQFNVNMFKL
ncbi:Trafficking protein particle complex subunit 12 [Podila epigama]|nr:Trafficking protein particle complex subunit 12 [Podila epigama]